MLDDVQKLRGGESISTKIARGPLISRRSAVVSGLALLVIGIAAAVGFSLTGNPGGSIGNQVPNVVGLTVEQARALLTDYTVTLQRAHDPAIPKGRIASQIPFATSQAPKGSAVVLTVSDGPGDATVPENLIGMSLIDARAELAASGLVIARTEASSSDQPQGTVLSVSPEPGSIVTAGTGIVLTIASGEVEVPNLIGVESGQAKTQLIQLGFLFKEFTDYDPTQPIGFVIRQSPEPGTTQTIGKSVTIAINKAP
jgi:serine/threonine-protein kinase